MRHVLHAGLSLAAGLALWGGQAIAGDGIVYVPEGSANAILVLDPASGEVVRRIEGVPAVHGLAAGPKGEFLVAGSFAESAPGGAPPKPEGMSADEHAAHHGAGASAQRASKATSYVSIVRPEDGTVTRRIEVPGAVHHTAVSPDGSYAVATHPGGDAISIIDLETFELEKTVATGPLPNYAVISGDGTRIYVSNAGNDTVSEVDAERGIVLRNVVVGASPEHLVLAPDGEHLYVANVDDGTVSAVALPEGKVDRTFEIGGLLHGLDLANDGATLFVSAREADQVVGVDLRSGVVERRSLSPQPYHLTAAGERIYVTSAGEPKLWVLDAGSLDVIGEIPLQDIGHQVVVAPEPTA